MAKQLTWNADGQRFFETGIEKVAIYKKGSTGEYGVGVAWEGVTALNESPSGAEATKLFANDTKYGELISAEEFGATLECYTYPDEFGQCNGEVEMVPGMSVGQQARVGFGLTYKTLIGSDAEATGKNYKLHIVYGAMSKPSERSHGTVNDSPEADTMSFEITTTPVPITTKVEGQELKPTSHLVLDTRKIDAAKIKKIEDALYGSSTADPKILLPDEVYEILNASA